MANDWDDDEDLDYDPRSNNESTIKAIRKAEREKDKALKAERERVSALEGQLRDLIVQNTVKEKNLNPKIAGLIPRDLPPTEITKWIEDYSDVFGLASTDTPPAGSQEPPAEDGLAPLPDPAVEALARMGAASPGAQPYQNTTDALLQRIAAAQSPEELNQLIHGNPMGPEAF